MQNKIEDANRQAAEARKRAAASNDTSVRDEWLQVALMWEALAREYGQLPKFRDKT
jgi:hypothetical protein